MNLINDYEKKGRKKYLHKLNRTHHKSRNRKKWLEKLKKSGNQEENSSGFKGEMIEVPNIYRQVVSVGNTVWKLDPVHFQL